MFIAGKYSATPVAVADGMDVQVATDEYGNVKTVGGAAGTAPLRTTPLDALGNPVADFSAAVEVKPETVATAAVTAVGSQAISIALLAANANRKRVMISNTDANPLYVKYGAAASLTSHTVRIAPDGYWEMPDPVYTGDIFGIWTVDGAGNAVITEL